MLADLGRINSKTFTTYSFYFSKVIEVTLMPTVFTFSLLLSFVEWFGMFSQCIVEISKNNFAAPVGHL